MFPTKPIVTSSVTTGHCVKHSHRPGRACGQIGRKAIMQGDEEWELQSGNQQTPKLLSQNTTVYYTHKMY